MAGIGFEVASEVVAGLLVGYGIDHWAGTGQRWTIIGAIVGICVGLFSLIRGSLKLNRQLERKTPVDRTLSKTETPATAIDEKTWDAFNDDTDHRDDEDSDARRG